MINKPRSRAISGLNVLLTLTILILATVLGFVSYQYVGSTVTTTTTVTSLISQTETITQSHSVLVTTLSQTYTTTQFVTATSPASSVALSGVNFTIGATEYTLINSRLSFPTNSTVTFVIVLYNFVLDSSNSSMTNLPPLARAVNGTDISQATAQYWNFHVLGYSQAFNLSPPENDTWYQGMHLSGTSKGAVPNYGNDTLYVALLMPPTTYNGFLVVRIF